ncbi:MAG TPA: outer membrane protein transport protein, partial [Thermodesulfobacteriota bacterium]|nr:outer membrane protein transport protein [Thermodesulfobacteriota bacterium]
MNVKKIILLLIAFFLFIPSISFGGGFLIYNQDAAATGQGLAFTAQADNPSAVFYNPAAINRLDGTQFSSGSTIIMPQTSFKSALTGSKTDMESHIYLLPNIFITHKIN